MELVLPKLGLTMTEAMVAQWMVRPGEGFAAGATLVVIETDKITMDVEAPAAGVLERVLVAEGETVPVGTPIAHWQPADGGRAAGRNRSAFPPPTGDGEAAVGGGESASPPHETPIPRPERGPPGGARVVATPLARRLAAEHGVSLHRVTGTGPNGRIKAADVERARAEAAGSGRVDSEGAANGQPESRREVPAPHQRTMSTRMAADMGQVPHLHLIAEVPAEPMLAMCEMLNKHAAPPRITLTHLVLAAVGQTLVELPEANRVWDDGGLRALARPDVGLAVETPQGLIAAVIRDAGVLRLQVLRNRADDLVERAAQARLTPDESTGGAATVTDLGGHDVSVVLPVIHPGQSANLGVGRVRPVARVDKRGQVTAGKEISLVLGCDHRVYDGVSGARFLKGIRDRLSNPYLLSLT